MLAKCIITDIHGPEEYEKALKISTALFTEEIKNLKAKDIIESIKDVPSFKIKDGDKLIDILVNNNVTSSKREAREFLSSNAISINNEKVSDENLIITKDLAIDQQIVLIKKGKKKFYIGYLD